MTERHNMTVSELIELLQKTARQDDTVRIVCDERGWSGSISVEWPDHWKGGLIHPWHLVKTT